MPGAHTNKPDRSEADLPDPEGPGSSQPSPDPDGRRKGAAYQGALEAVFAILITTGAGYLADQHFGTSPLYLFLGVLVGFGSFVLRLWRLGRQQLGPPD